MDNKINIKDTEVLNEFQNQLDAINNKACEHLSKFDLIFEEMNNCWSGNSASCFKENYKELLKELKDNHLEMLNRDKILGLIGEDVESLDKSLMVEER